MKAVNKLATPFAAGHSTAQTFLPKLTPAWPYGLLLLLIPVFLWPMFASGKLPFMRDMFFDFVPQHSFAKGVFWSGHIPLWISHSGFGEPFAADPLTATFYPLHAAFYLFSTPTALRIYCAMHLWLAGASMFALARHWQMDVAPALVTAVSCMFSSWFIANLEFANNLGAVVWAPFIVLTVSHIMRTLRGEDVPRRIIGLVKLTTILAFLFAVQYLSGFPEFLVYTSILAVTFVIALCAFDRAFRVLIGTLATFLVAGLLAILVSAPQLLLSMQFVPLSERATKINPGLHMASLQLHNLLQFVLPFINGRPGYPDQFWGGTIFEFWIGTCYLGILPLVLAGFSILVFWRGDSQRERKFVCAFLLGATLFGITMALGKNTPLYQFLYDTVPGFGYFRFPSKFLLLVLFAVSLLAGLGCQQILDISKSPTARLRLRKLILISGSLIIGVFVCGYFFALNGPHIFQFLTNGLLPNLERAYHGELSDYLLAIIFLVGSFGVSLTLSVRANGWMPWLAPALVFTNLFFVTSGLHHMVDQSVYQVKPENLPSGVTDPKNPRIHSVYGPVQQWLYASGDDGLIKWAASAGVGSSWLPFGINQTWQSGQKLGRYVALYYLLWSLPAAQREKLADLLSIRYELVGAPFDQICWQGASRSLQLIERPRARPRAFLLGNWVRVARVDNPGQAVSEILEKMLAPDFDAARTAIVEPTVVGVSPADASIPAPDAADDSDAGDVHSFQDNVNETLVHVTAKRKALFVLNDAWYPGWTALVDGVAQPIFRTNFHFRGVFLEPGDHELRFVFAPQRFRIGLWIASSTVMLVGMLFLFLNHLTKKLATPSDQRNLAM